jgi:cell division protein FtsQ
MQQVTQNDPAPSRLNYRLNRLMLTPVVWVFLKVLLPVAIVLVLLLWWASDAGRRQAAFGIYTGLWAQFQSQDVFRVQSLSFQGASPIVTEDIREVLALDFPISSFELDLPLMRSVVVGLDAIETADLQIENRVLTVTVTERVPVVIWRKRGGLELIDAQGVLVGPAKRRTDWPNLPVITGEGADQMVEEALQLLEVAKPVLDRLRGLERRGARRWDLVLTDDQKILLPEENATDALRRVLAYDQSILLLSRDVALVDMRLPYRTTVRLRSGGLVDYIASSESQGLDVDK